MADIDGDNNDNILTGGFQSDTIRGFGGNDELYGAGGNDFLDGGTGNDLLDGGSGVNSLIGGAGADTFLMSFRGSQIQTIEDFSQAENDQIDVRILNVADLDTLMPYISQVGNDLHIETFWADSNGSTPNEVIIVEDFSFNDLVASDLVFNTINVDIDTSINSVFDYVLFGGNGDDELTQQGSGDDELNGGAGDDVLAGGSGTNLYRGGLGADTFAMIGRGSQIQTIEDFSQAENDQIDVRILNVADLDTLMPYISQVGNDLHIETFWADSNGSTPNEVIIVEDFSFNDLVASDLVFNTINVDIDTSINSVFDYVLFGGNGDDELTQQGSGDDELNGGAGDDVLAGGSGTNLYRGGLGADTFAMIGRGSQIQTIEDFSQAENDQIDVRILNVADLDTLMPYISQVGNDLHIETFWADSNGSTPNEVIIVEDFSFNDLVASDLVFNTINVDIDTSINSVFDYVLFGGNGDDELTQQGSGDNELNGGAGDDVLLTGSGDDILRGGVGRDDLDAGSGTDTVGYETSSASVSLDLSTSMVSGGDAEGDTIANFENAIGSQFGDFLRGNSVRNFLDGQAGDDILEGSAGDDVLEGGAGNDTLRAGSDDDVANGGIGDDVLIGNSGEDALSGGDGNDLIIGGGDDDAITGDAGDDQLSGQGGDDDIFGGDGNDTILGGSGRDDISGGDGLDDINAGGGNDSVDGDIGNDILAGGAGFDTVRGGVGNDTIFGNNQDDDLFGEEGDDILFGGGGNDTLDGGIGEDNLSGGASQDTVNGGDGDDMLFGNSGGDTLNGGDGRDTLEGGGGNDTLFGGNGNDIFVQNSGFGTDRIRDFSNGGDLIDLSGNNQANSFADVLADASQAGSTVRIEFNVNNILVIENFTLADLDASDFIF